MANDCGANKEAVILPIVSAFWGFSRKRNHGVAGLPQTPAAANSPLAASGYFFSNGAPEGALK
jgi:hypothetical protein